MGCCPLQSQSSLVSVNQKTEETHTKPIENSKFHLFNTISATLRLPEIVFKKKQEPKIEAASIDSMDEFLSKEMVEKQREEIKIKIKVLEADYLKILSAEKELKRIELDLQDAEKDHVDWMMVKHDMVVSQRRERSVTRRIASITETSQIYRFDLPVNPSTYTITRVKSSLRTNQSLIEEDTRTKMYIETSENNRELADKYLEKLTSISSPFKLGHYRLIALLGKGCCGKVLLSYDPHEKKMVALKTVKKCLQNSSLITNEKMVKDVFSPNWHPFIVKIYSIFQTNGHLVFVMEFLEGRTLNICLSVERVFTENRTRFYAGCILLAIGYLHSRDISHRDIKLDNIVIDRKGYPKLIDFGMAEENVKHNTPILEKSGTRLYQGPEFYLPGMITRRSSDFWALGVMIHAMLTGKFISISPIVIIDHAHVSRVAYDLLKKIFATNPLERLGAGPNGARDLMRHSFFKKSNWDELLMRKTSAPFFITKPYKVSTVEEDWNSIISAPTKKMDNLLKDIEWLEVRKSGSISSTIGKGGIL